MRGRVEEGGFEVEDVRSSEGRRRNECDLWQGKRRIIY